MHIVSQLLSNSVWFTGVQAEILHVQHVTCIDMVRYAGISSTKAIIQILAKTNLMHVRNCSLSGALEYGGWPGQYNTPPPFWDTKRVT